MNEYSYFTKALEEVFEERSEELIASLDAELVCEHSQSNSRKIKKLIKRRAKPYYALISTGLRRAACIAAAVIIVSMSALSVKAVREAVYNFFMWIFSDHTQVTASKQGDYPTTIEEEYYISELPEGFELAEHDATEFSVNTIYTNDENYIFFAQTTKDAYNGYFDNEHSESYYFEGSSQEYLVFDFESDYIIIWDNGNYIFEIRGNLNKEDIIDLCKSAKKK